MDVSIHEAKTHLSRLLDLVEDGEEVIIHHHGRPVARLTRLKSEKIQLGAMAGEFRMADGWDRPLADDEADALWQGT